MEFIAPVEHYLDAFIGILKLLLEVIAAICVLIGLVRTMQLAVTTRRRRNVQLPYLNAMCNFTTMKIPPYV